MIEKLAEEGITMLIVTHEMRFAFTISDRVVFMEQGRIEIDAPPEEIAKCAITGSSALSTIWLRPEEIV